MLMAMRWNKTSNVVRCVGENGPVPDDLRANKRPSTLHITCDQGRVENDDYEAYRSRFVIYRTIFVIYFFSIIKIDELTMCRTVLRRTFAMILTVGGFIIASLICVGDVRRILGYNDVALANISM
jgi:hypothetical protein